MPQMRPDDYRLPFKELCDCLYVDPYKCLAGVFRDLSRICAKYVAFLDELDDDEAAKLLDEVVVIRDKCDDKLASKGQRSGLGRTPDNDIPALAAHARRFGSHWGETRRYSRQPRETKVKIANYVRVCETLEELVDFVKDFRDAMWGLLDEVTNGDSIAERTNIGLSRLARLEVRGVGTLLEEMFRLTTFYFEESPPDVQRARDFARLLTEFIGHAEARHNDRLSKGQCSYCHDGPYRKLMTSGRRIVAGLLDIALVADTVRA